jgi:signal transduction histidine kinase
MRLRKINTFLKHHRLWLITLIVALPLLTITVVQYRSLRTLEQTLPVYRRELMFQFLRTVSREVNKTYSDNASRVLGVPANAIVFRRPGIVEENAEQTRVLAAVGRVAEHFKQQEFRGALRYFLFLATERNGESGDAVLFYNPARQALEFDPQAAELRAIKVACAPYLIYMRTRAVVQPQPVSGERDPEHPLMLKPILDSERMIVAVAGFTMDQKWFRNEVVPDLIKSTLPRLFPAELQDAVITLYFMNEVVYSTQSADKREPEVSSVFSPLFTRYGLGLRMRSLSIEQWARRSFMLNLTLSLVMTLALVGGLLLGVRAASRELKLSQMKTDFVANVSHEFRTPLSSILVLAELMKLGRVKDTSEVREFGQYIDSQGHRLMQLINNILDFSRIESGQKDFQFERADVREVVSEALAACAGQLKQSGHTIQFEPPQVALPPLLLDTDALTLALTNLLDNAIKYSGNAKEIIVRLGRNGEAVKVSVTDHGIGITREEQARIFDKFYRVGTGMVHDVKGSGLGLAIVKHIVEAHRGKVTIESEPGRGSTFTIHLPIVEADAPPHHQAQHDEAAQDKQEG